MIPEHIFRAYDIRGIVGKDLFPDIILRCSAIFANLIQEKNGKRVAVSGDVRLSTPSFVHSAVSGIIATGLDAQFFYPLPIPVFNYAIWSDKNIDGGAFVTASHNPPEYNGIRFRRNDGTGFSHENKIIKERFIHGKIKFSSWNQFGAIIPRSNTEIIANYVDFVGKIVPSPSSKLKIIIDGKHGASNLVAPKIFSIFHDLILIDGTINGAFPSGMPDPLHGDVSKIKKTIQQTKADMGISYDGDGDRAAFFDENGRILPAEIIGLFLAENLLKPGDTIVYNVMCSSILKRKAEEMGFRTVECRVGDVFVAESAKENNAKLCVEESYHFFLPMFGFYYDDSILTSIVMANLLSSSEYKLSRIHDKYGHFFVIRENLPVSDERKFSVINKFQEWALEKYTDVSTLDGVKIYLENASFLARPSNTEPLIRIVAEGENKDQVMGYLKLFKKKLMELIQG